MNATAEPRTIAEFLANIAWHAQRGPQSTIADGGARARRYARGYSPIAGFADPVRPDFDALAPLVAPGEAIYAGGWNGPAPDGWTVEFDSTMFQMVWHGGMPDPDPSFAPVVLGTTDAHAMVELADLTHPGPFGPRTVDMGRYYGVVEHGRLIAMAGERMHAGPLREISGVATHPDAQGRGHARRLMLRLVREQLARGEVPFLHVMSGNVHARGLYARMGFRDHAEVAVRRFAKAAA